MKVRQLLFSAHGGKRRGAGRKPKGAKARVAHDTRPATSARFPVLVTWKLAAGKPSLRQPQTRDVLHDALRAAGDRHGIRVVHFSLQSNQIHALVEARDARSLARGMQGLTVRVGRGLHRSWSSVGRVFADRFHSRVLRTPREVRYALAYVLNNARKHGLRLLGIDPYSSGAAFEGWLEANSLRASARRAPVLPARSWLLNVGWLRHGHIPITEVPGSST